MQEVYEIHIDNGWPSNFDREKCRIQLDEFLEREEGPSHRPQGKSEQDLTAVRQRMLERRQERLRRKGGQDEA